VSISLISRALNLTPALLLVLNPSPNSTLLGPTILPGGQREVEDVQLGLPDATTWRSDAAIGIPGMIEEEVGETLTWCLTMKNRTTGGTRRIKA